MAGDTLSVQGFDKPVSGDTGELALVVLQQVPVIAVDISMPITRDRIDTVDLIESLG